MRMPEPDRAIIARRAEVVSGLEALVAPGSVISDRTGLRVYETDGLTAYRQVPMAVVLPANTDEVSTVLRFCHDRGIKVVPRGGGTSLSGGALPLADGIVLSAAKLNRVLEIDLANQCAVVQPGVTNLAITDAVSDAGYYYAPDPSSQIACTIGGNVAENAGGVHCLKYGLTTNNLLGLEAVLITGEVIRIGGKHFDSEAYDLLGIITGSEGLLCVVTEATVRLLRKPQAVQAVLAAFPDNTQAGDCVARIIGAGLIPAGMEMMDGPAIAAAEAFCHAGYPLDAGALLIVEVDGSAQDVLVGIARVKEIATACGATEVRASRSEDERLVFWSGRKNAFPAIGRISPDYYVMDGTIPRRRLSEMLRLISELSAQSGLRIANVFHAGDGNLHPMIMYDSAVPGELERTEALGAEILKACVRMGGVLTGEHGVGIEKRDLMDVMFDAVDLDHQQRLKCAFDADGLLNPGKVFPVLHRCAELGRLHVHHGQVPFPDLPRF
ncbi:MAG: FAD-binding protein [Proteobacteria bacterium]|nr:FAD-binding protein [Pseudomonadota bacterium]